MPDMDGFAVCKKFKESKVTCEIPIIFLSALSDTSDKVKAFSIGGVDYISKPFQAEEVLARVNTHLSLRSMQKELERHNHHLEDLVVEKMKELNDSQLATLVAISKLSEFRDLDTGMHIERTRNYCALLAKQLQQIPRDAGVITRSYIENIINAAPLHDIGKVGIPDSILLKPGKLTVDEFEIMKTHVSIGVKALTKVQEMYPKNAFINLGIDLAGAHHEKWNGSGYPKGLQSENIPLSGRIMAVADVYDALRSKRPYKEPLSHKQSLQIIIDDSGTHFDPTIVGALQAIEMQFAKISEELRDHACRD